MSFVPRKEQEAGPKELSPTLCSVGSQTCPLGPAALLFAKPVCMGVLHFTQEMLFN